MKLIAQVALVVTVASLATIHTAALLAALSWAMAHPLTVVVLLFFVTCALLCLAACTRSGQTRDYTERR